MSLLDSFNPLNVLGSITNSPQQYQQAPMDPNSQLAISDSQSQLSQSPGQNQANILEGTGAATEIANQTANQTAQQSEQGGGGINGMTAAIGNKNAKNFATSQGRLSQAASIQGMQMTNSNEAMASKTSMALSKAQEGITSQSNALDIAANAARYNTVSSLMGGAGSMAGSAWGRSIFAGGSTNSNPLQYDSAADSEYAGADYGGAAGAVQAGDSIDASAIA